MNSKEIKVAEAIANAVEDHWFNPAAVGRYLADQPFYTLDRVMELVAWVIEKQARRFDLQKEAGEITEGLFLANELDKVVDTIKLKYKLENIKLP
jgi:hypothetical protein